MGKERGDPSMVRAVVICMGAYRRSPFAWLIPAALISLVAAAPAAAAPNPPSFDSTAPVSPANDNNPLLFGTADPGTTVLIYEDSGCTDPPTTSGSAEDFASTGIPVTVGDNSSTTFWGKTDDGAEESGCSTSSITYVEDSESADPPTITDTDPESPANHNGPLVQGTVGGGGAVHVLIYENSGCTGTPSTGGTVAEFTGSGIAVTVDDDMLTNLSATTLDQAGNESSCSNSIAYVEDSTVPSAPILTDTDPDSPANDNAPEIKGTAEAGSTVTLYASDDCTGGFVKTGSATDFASPGFTVAVANDSSTTYSATATDLAGNTSDCSTTTITYVEDSTGPDLPTLDDTDPDSPANANNPKVKGTAESGSTVRLYTTSDCSTVHVASGSAATFASPGIGVVVDDNTTTTFYAKATDAAGNPSGCSTDSITYVEDSTPPGTPSITDTDPDSPANDANPEVKGTAEAGSTVQIWKNGTCTGAPDASGGAADFASPGITVNVTEDATTTLSAMAVDAAGNESECSTAFTYVEQSTPPATPTITDTDPNSPANDHQPEVKGTAAAGSTVNLYTTSDCTGSPVATGSAANFASPGLTVTVGNDSTTNLRATATNAAGTSSCSAPFTYVEDSTALAPTVSDTDPESPANDNTPQILGTALEPNVTVKLYTNNACTGPAAATGTGDELNSPGIAASVADNSTTTFWATVTDAAGNTSDCSASSVTYVEDSTPPGTPSITDTDPDSPANDNNPEVKGTAEAGSTVQIWKNGTCTGAPDASGSAADFASPGITVNVTEDATTTFSVKAVDDADNASACSSSFTYVEQSTPPAAPTIADSDPDSPANDNTPEIKGTAAAGTTVNLYTTSDCTGTPAATGTAAQFASPGLTVTVANDSTTTLRATAANAAGPSACSDPFTYVEDSTPPAAPSVTGTTPNSPANNNNPKVKGTVGSGAPVTVRVYKSTDCTGGVAGSGTVAEFTGTGISIGTVADDTTTQLSARTVDAAGNESDCSQPPDPPATPVVYVEDSTAPPAPTMTETIPASPANDNSPEIRGTADPDVFTVRIYANSSCTGTPHVIGLRSNFVAPGPGITVSVADDTVTTFSARARDRANNEGPCSPTTITYTEQSTGGVPTPTFTDTDPDSPANDNAPEIKGTAPAGSAVALYTTSNCSGPPVATGSAADFASPGLTVAVGNDSTTTFYATATDASSQVSACSSGDNGSITYVEDSTAPALPTLDDTDPDSPANDNDPEVKGTAESGSTVDLYTTSDCTGPAAATGSAASFASPGLTVTVGDNSSTTYYARATDAAGNASGCSTDSIAYVEDSTGPAAPTIADTDPDSPANDNNPEVKGTTGAGDPVTVKVYKTADCTGGSTDGTVAAFTGSGITVSVPGDTTTTFTAKTVDAAGNESTCSNTFAYVEDSTAPGLPTLDDTDPDSPANDNEPEVEGTAESGSTVALYTTSDCSGSPAVTGSAASFASPGLTVTVGNDSTTTFYARATDAAGNPSGCSTDSIAYVEDSTAPALPTLDDTDPDSPANDNNPEVKGTAESGSTVRLYTTSDCTGPVATSGSAAGFSSPGLTVTVANDSSTTFRATATDAAGNTSDCSTDSIAYVEDSTSPAKPSIADTDPDSPANDANPEVKGTAEGGSTVQAFKNTNCSGAPAASGSVATFASPGITVNVTEDAQTTLTVRAVDPSGNQSACSDPVTYREDSTAPAAATGLSTVPASPSNANGIKVKGSAESGSTVRLYTTSDCSGTPTTGSAFDFNNNGIDVTVPSNSTTTFRAKVTDAAGNASGCSTDSVTYVEDSTAPGTPTIDALTSPANDNDIEIEGSTAGGDPTQIKLYRSSDCSGSPHTTVPVATFTGSGIAQNVANDTTTTFTVRATDAAGNDSGCSNAVTYVEDSTAPAAPAITDTDPDSPANDVNPEVKGTVGGGSPTQVRVFETADCTGPSTNGTPTEFAGAGITVNVAANASTLLSAKTVDAAGNESGCSPSVNYVEDSSAPAAPAIADLDPDSPSNDNSVEVKGTTGAGTPATVEVFENGSCSGAPAATGGVAQFTGSGITTEVPSDATTTLSARARDAVGNASDCSNSVQYLEDSTAPSIEIRSPAGGASFAQGASVNADYSCSDGGSGLAGGGDGCRGSVGVGQPIDTVALGTRSLNVTARDRVGNTAEATRSYTVFPTTTTTLECSPNPARVDQAITCRALVRRNDTSGSGAPTGTVVLSSIPVDATGECTLAPTSTPGSAACEIAYTPRSGAADAQVLAASYSGDASSAPSAGELALSLLTTSLGDNRTISFDGAGQGTLPITCKSQAGDCTGTVEIRTGSPPSGRLAKAKTTVLGKGRYRVKRGRRGSATIKLTRAGKAQLKRRRRLSGHAVIRGRQGKGPVRVSTVRVKLRGR